MTHESEGPTQNGDGSSHGSESQSCCHKAYVWVYLHDMNTCIIPDTTNGTAIYAYIDPQNHPNVGRYGIHGVSGYIYIYYIHV